LIAAARLAVAYGRYRVVLCIAISALGPEGSRCFFKLFF
jgi:hypothetical protein